MIKIENGRLVDPANDIDTITDVYIENGIIAAIGMAPVDANITQTIDTTDQIICP
jgi:dihydroorotase